MKTGRNDPCPCGSGLKYKKCCEAKGETARVEQLAADNAKLADIDPEAAEDAKRKGDAAARREGFSSRSRQVAPGKRPSHVRKRTV